MSVKWNARFVKAFLQMERTSTDVDIVDTYNIEVGVSNRYQTKNFGGFDQAGSVQHVNQEAKVTPVHNYHLYKGYKILFLTRTKMD